jgi:hypothetical protein
VDPTESSASFRLPTEAKLAETSGNPGRQIDGVEGVLPLQGFDLAAPVTTSSQPTGAR